VTSIAKEPKLILNGILNIIDKKPQLTIKNRVNKLGSLAVLLNNYNWVILNKELIND
jgi:hypothetical protein